MLSSDRDDALAAAPHGAGIGGTDVSEAALAEFEGADGLRRTTRGLAVPVAVAALVVQVGRAFLYARSSCLLGPCIWSASWRFLSRVRGCGLRDDGQSGDGGVVGVMSVHDVVAAALSAR